MHGVVLYLGCKTLDTGRLSQSIVMTHTYLSWRLLNTRVRIFSSYIDYQYGVYILRIYFILTSSARVQAERHQL